MHMCTNTPAVAMETTSESGWSKYSVDPEIRVSTAPLINWKCQERGSEVLPRAVMAGCRLVLLDDTKIPGLNFLCFRLSVALST